MKKKLLLMCIAGALVMTAVIGGTLAGMNKETDEESVAEIKVNSFKIAIDESTSSTTGTSEGDSLRVAAVPGGTAMVSRSFTNTGAYDLYARAVIDRNWDTDLIKVVYDKDSADDWFIFADDGKQIIMYYKNVVGTTDATKTVALPMTGISFDAALNNDYAGKEIEFDIRIDAVQAAVVKDSMLSEWGVFPVIDGKGRITDIEE